MQNLWQRYEAWLAANYPDGLQALNPGASDAQLSALETTLGQTLPDDYRAWLAGHNGENDTDLGMMSAGEFLSTERTASEWQKMVTLAAEVGGPITTESEPDGHIVPVWWHRGWIPITSDGAGNLECLDLNPGPAGTVGQVIDFDHETVHRTVVATSFRAWIEQFVADVEAGEYAYSDDYGRFIPIDQME